MMDERNFESIELEKSGHVGTIFLNRPPHNFFDIAMIQEIASALRLLDDDSMIRAVVLAARGKSFCAGADLVPVAMDNTAPQPPSMIYIAGVELMRTRKPIIAAVQGAAIGGGLGLACTADFRVTCPEARFAANFCRIGYHPGFGLTAFLPRLIGAQRAARMMYTGERIGGEAAVDMGLADVLVPDAASVLAGATELATQIAESAPLSVMATRETLRKGMADLYETATNRERAQQDVLRATFDFAEGVSAYAERRQPQFRGA